VIIYVHHTADVSKDFQRYTEFLLFNSRHNTVSLSKDFQRNREFFVIISVLHISEMRNEQ
jgi:hypothetical protein